MIAHSDIMHMVDINQQNGQFYWNPNTHIESPDRHYKTYPGNYLGTQTHAKGDQSKLNFGPWQSQRLISILTEQLMNEMGNVHVMPEPIKVDKYTWTNEGSSIGTPVKDYTHVGGYVSNTTTTDMNIYDKAYTSLGNSNEQDS